MDGPNVNLKVLDEIQNEQIEWEQHQLINVGSCGLHTPHSAFKTEAGKAGREIKKLFKEAFSVFHDSPTRREHVSRYLVFINDVYLNHFLQILLQTLSRFKAIN